MQPQQQYVPNLVVAKTDDPRPFRVKGEQCMRDCLTVHDTRQVYVLAHNFQGYDSYFVVHEYHGQNRFIQQLRNGASLLEVLYCRIPFIEFLSFFHMPLAAFPETFGLTELKKFYFPY